MRLIGCILALAASLLLAGAAAAKAPASDQITILISIDGFRADYLDRGLTPTLSALARDGVRGALEPSFPSVTFPNHYTLVTGLYPDHHGIVDNHFEDHALGRVWDLGDLKGALDPVWWKAATPLWVTARAQGVRSASMFWPSLGFDRDGHPPALSVDFDPKLPMQKEPDQVLAWLDLPAAERPRFVMLYFFYVDHFGHQAGPDGKPTQAAMADADAAIGRLVAGLKTRGLFDRTNLVVVADHGMAEVSKDRVIELDPLVDLDHLRVVTSGALAGLDPRPGFGSEVDKALLGRHGHMRCWRKGDLPARFHYGRNPRVPPILCLADVGWEIVTRASEASWPADNHGDHGFDPADPSMAAVFVAHGPAFRHGVVWPKVPNVDVYPLLARILAIRPRPNDGHMKDVQGMLASSPPPRRGRDRGRE